MSDDLVERLSVLHVAATPAELETAEIKEGQDWFLCPHCDGAGEVEAEQYINYDGVAANVLFSGIGHEFGANRDWYMEVTSAWPSVAAEITTLRERLEQAERERDEWKDAAKRSHEEYYAGGFRAGIEAASERLEESMTIDGARKVIRDLSPTDTTSTVAEAAKVLLDKHDELLKQSKFRTANSFRKTEVLAFLRALAAQKGE